VSQTKSGRKMEEFDDKWLPKLLQDFSKLKTEEKEATINGLLGILAPREKWLLQTILPDLLFRDFVTNLPTEILENILSFVSCDDLLNCCQVSKSWNRCLTGLAAVWRLQASKLGMTTTSLPLHSGQLPS
jgi:hypothetical protein